jgi:hypothetical protein
MALLRISVGLQRLDNSNARFPYFHHLKWACLFGHRAPNTINARLRSLLKVEPMRMLAGSVAVTFALLFAGLAAGAVSGAFTWQAGVTAGIAVLIVAAGLLYAWRLGAPGRRR